MTDSQEMLDLLRETKSLADRYYQATGRPLGCTGEVAEYEAATLLGLKLAPVRQAGYDAVRTVDGVDERVQIKGRCVHGSRPAGRLGRIDVANPEWDSVMLVLLDEHMDATAIYQAKRGVVVEALSAPGSRSRNERGAMAVSKFISIASQVWPEPLSNNGINLTHAR